MKISIKEINTTFEDDGTQTIVVRLQNDGGYSSNESLDAYIPLTNEDVKDVSFADKQQLERIAKDKLVTDLSTEEKPETADP